MPPNAPSPWTALFGKVAAPQRHEQAQAPPGRTVPLPPTIAEDGGAFAGGGAAAAGGAGAGAAAAGGGGAAPEAAGGAGAAAGPPTIGEAVPVPFCETARALKLAWDLAAVGLMEKVIPFPQ